MVGDLARTLHQRSDLLSLLVSEPLGKREVEGRVDASRSTVDRAIRDLETAGLVERTDDGYVATAAGRLAADVRSSYLETVDSIERAQSLLALLPRDVPVDDAMIVGADVELATAPSKFEPLERLKDLIRESERYRGMSAANSGTGFGELFRERVVEHDLDLEFVLTAEMAAHLSEHLTAEWREIHEHGFSAYTVESIPFGLGIADHGSDATVALLVYDDQLRLAGLVFNDDPAAVEWAEDVYGSYRERATEVVVSG